MNNDQVTTADLDREDLAQDAWVAMLVEDRRHPGKINGLAAAGTLEGYMNQATMHAWSLRDRRSRRAADAESQWAASQSCDVALIDGDEYIAADDDVFVDVDAVDVDMVDVGLPRTRLWEPLAAMYQAPATSNVVSEAWAAKIRTHVRPIGAKGIADPIGVHRMLDLWAAGELSDRETLMLFAPWCTERELEQQHVPFHVRVELPDFATMERIVWVLRRVGVHADVAWNSALSAATRVHARHHAA